MGRPTRAEIDARENVLFWVKAGAFVAIACQLFGLGVGLMGYSGVVAGCFAASAAFVLVITADAFLDSRGRVERMASRLLGEDASVEDASARLLAMLADHPERGPAILLCLVAVGVPAFSGLPLLPALLIVFAAFVIYGAVIVNVNSSTAEQKAVIEALRTTGGEKGQAIVARYEEMVRADLDALVAELEAGPRAGSYLHWRRQATR
jgi:hypothetical protein